MARVLIVGCGCRGQSLARGLVAAGHTVRGTTRDPRRIADIDASGAEPYIGDPDRIATLMDALASVTVVAWLLGTADARDLHDGRLRMLCEKLVDTPVRGLLYEVPSHLEWATRGHEIVAHARTTWNIPVETLDTPPQASDEWLADARRAVDRLLAPR